MPGTFLQTSISLCSLKFLILKDGCYFYDRLAFLTALFILFIQTLCMRFHLSTRICLNDLPDQQWHTQTIKLFQAHKKAVLSQVSYWVVSRHTLNRKKSQTLLVSYQPFQITRRNKFKVLQIREESIGYCRQDTFSPTLSFLCSVRR